MMTVLDEINNMGKYKYLEFVEFLEMFARVILVGIQLNDTIEYKGYLLLEIIHKKLVSYELIDVEEYPMIEPENNLRT